MIEPISLDVPTLFIASALVVTLTGILFIVDTLSRGDDAVGRLWSLAYIAAITTTFSYLMSSVYPHIWWGVPLGNGAAVLGFGAIWAGARRFNGRRMLLPIILIAPVAVALVALVQGPAGGYWAGADVMFWAMAAFGLLAGAECLRPRLRGFHNARFLSVVMLISGGYYLIRVIFLYSTGPNSTFFSTFFGSGITSLILVLFVTGGAISMVALRGEESRQTFIGRINADEMTGAASPDQFAHLCAGIMDADRASGRPVAFIATDIDELVTLNAAFGRSYGDRVLTRFVDVVRAATPPATPLCRVVADRFVFLLPGATTREAVALAERIRSSLIDTPLVLEQAGVRVTASFGVAGSEDFGHDLKRLQSEAFTALAASKSAGRNRVVAAPVVAGESRSGGR